MTKSNKTSPLTPAKPDRLHQWSPGPLDRRQFLRLVETAIAAAGLAGCRVFPDKRALPFVRAPAFGAAGLPQIYATTVSVLGEEAGVLAATFEGKPHKLEGNPEHAACLGASSALIQAQVLSLYDPDRLQAPACGSQSSTWEAFTTALRPRLERLQATHGRGLYVVLGELASPSAEAQLSSLLERYPQARCFHHEPWTSRAMTAGCETIFGAGWQPSWRFQQARCIVAADADFLQFFPGSLAHARAFASRRDPESSGGKLNRLYAIEPSPTLTGAMADHRRTLKPQLIGVWLESLAAELGMPGYAKAAGLPEEQATFLRLIASDLLANRGQSIVLAGLAQPAPVHALAFAINAHLGNAVTTLELRRTHSAAISVPLSADLGHDMAQGQVDTLLVLGTNPAYTAPAAYLLDHLEKVPFSAALSSYLDETAKHCLWRLPLSHDLEAWGDSRAFDGSISLRQPVMNPLFQSRSLLEMLALCNDAAASDGYALVRDYWQAKLAAETAAKAPDAFEAWWRVALQRGVAVAAPASAAPAPSVKPLTSLALPTSGTGAGLFTLQFKLDPATGDGRYANNPWLQELPKPLTGLTWSNAALISSAAAEILAVQNGDEVRITRGDRELVAPVWIVPGQASEVVTLPLGYGRTAAGAIGTNLGFDAGCLRLQPEEWWADGVSIKRTGKRRELAITHGHHDMEGRDLARQILASAVPPPVANSTSTAAPDATKKEHAWGMAIDLSRCIACSACVTACQAENNIPAVGEAEVKRGREMHWIRVDFYLKHDRENRPRYVHQPVPCMHCENAPCEYVCPVGATVHNHEGINQMVYNRCVGTRYCSNNCPYKVRRFNFFHYSNDLPVLQREQRNPDVSVRPRGVMEKCTYCTQRITAARLKAEAEHRPLVGNEVVPACAQACPTEAIVFGDLNANTGRLAGKRASGRHYLLLEELGTKPHTSYLARVNNPHPDLAAEEGLL